MSTVADGPSTQGAVYVVVHAKWEGGDVSGSLLLDTGEVLWGHMSSSIGWLTRDLTSGFTDRRERLEAIYPNGYDVLLAEAEGVIPPEVIATTRTGSRSATAPPASRTGPARPSANYASCLPRRTPMPEREKSAYQQSEPGACADPSCPVLHSDPANPIHPSDYEPGGPMWDDVLPEGAS